MMKKKKKLKEKNGKTQGKKGNSGFFREQGNRQKREGALAGGATKPGQKDPEGEDAGEWRHIRGLSRHPQNLRGRLGKIKVCKKKIPRKLEQEW